MDCVTDSVVLATSVSHDTRLPTKTLRPGVLAVQGDGGGPTVIPPASTDKPLLLIVMPPDPTVTPVDVTVMPLFTVTDVAVSCCSDAVPEATVKPPALTVTPVS
jgi:hypothetical protein